MQIHGKRVKASAREETATLDMWRRVGSLSPLISSPQSTSLKQVLCRFSIWEAFTTMEVPAPVKDITSIKEKKPFIAFVLGGPGSGKGTQCVKIAETFGFAHLSAGELLRRELVSNSNEGTMILNTIKDGKIVPSEITVKLIQKEMEASKNNKFLIDGFPRCKENRMAFERIVGVEPNIVLFFDCPQEEMVKRVLNRNEGRLDDNIETVKKRLKIFAALNLPVVDYYKKKGKLHTIYAVGTVDEIFERVRPVFAELEAILNKDQ